MIEFPCKVCKAPLQVDESLAGKVVRCPTCLGVSPVPQLEMAGVASATSLRPPPAPRPSAPPQRRALMQTTAGNVRRYGFNCPFCSSRLDGSEANAGQEGSCPTCGNNIVVPILNRYGQLVDPITNKIIKPDPHPVHAYAAAGERAPAIVQKSGSKGWAIRCPRCKGVNDIGANSCSHCGIPFTMEGTAPAGSENSMAVAALVLGVIGVVGSCLVVPPILAIIVSSMALAQSNRTDGAPGRGMAIAGLVLGLIGAAITIYMKFF